jgi:hypothetical protein
MNILILESQHTKYVEQIHQNILTDLRQEIDYHIKLFQKS